MIKLIDLSMSIRLHWRWQVTCEFTLDHKKGDLFQSSVFSLPTHAFTHIDTPLHILPREITIDKVPLDRLCGQASIIDLSFVDENQPILLKDLQGAGKHLLPGDIVLLKTSWDLKRDWKTQEYWTEAPYVDEKAATWLAQQDICAVGFDFPQDYFIREIPSRHPDITDLPTHDLILRKGIYLIEYLCNLHLIRSDRTNIFALPLKLENAEGAPARVVAVEGY